MLDHKCKKKKKPNLTLFYFLFFWWEILGTKLDKVFYPFLGKTHIFTHFWKKTTFFILFKTLRIFLKTFSKPGNLVKFFTHFWVKLTLLLKEFSSQLTLFQNILYLLDYIIVRLWVKMGKKWEFYPKMDRKVHFLDLVKFLILLHVSYFVRIELFLDTVKILKARFLVTFMQICNENCSIIKTIILLKILEKFGPIEHTEKCNNSLQSSGDFSQTLRSAICL